jgi:hypothetical protein
VRHENSGLGESGDHLQFEFDNNNNTNETKSNDENGLPDHECDLCVYLRAWLVGLPRPEALVSNQSIIITPKMTMTMMITVMRIMNSRMRMHTPSIVNGKQRRDSESSKNFRFGRAAIHRNSAEIVPKLCRNWAEIVQHHSLCRGRPLSSLQCEAQRKPTQGCHVIIHVILIVVNRIIVIIIIVVVIIIVDCHILSIVVVVVIVVVIIVDC